MSHTDSPGSPSPSFQITGMTTSGPMYSRQTIKALVSPGCARWGRRPGALGARVKSQVGSALSERERTDLVIRTPNGRALEQELHRVLARDGRRKTDAP